MKIFLLSLNMSPLVDFMDRSAPGGTRIAFIPTAGNSYPDPTFVRDDRSRLQKLGLNPFDVDFDQLTRGETMKALETADAIYVAGGNTFYLLQAIEKRSMREPLKELIESGVPYIGASAGAVILADDIGYASPIDDPAAAPALRNHAGLAVIDSRPLPHFGKAKYVDLYLDILRADLEHEYLLLRDDRVAEITDRHSYMVSKAQPVDIAE